MENNFSILIPARIGSTRLLNKPLIDLYGKSLIQRVYEQARTISDDVYIATDSDLVLNHATSFTDNVVITSDKHISGTDRVYEAVKKLGIPKNKLIINLQGDEPFMPCELIQQIVSDYESNDCDVITASHNISSIEDLLNQNCVKVEINKNSFATDFLREVNTKDLNLYSRHIGVYGYNLETLESFINLSPSTNEIKLKLEQLRFMDNKFSIYVTSYDKEVPSGIDTKEDVEKAIKFIKMK